MPNKKHAPAKATAGKASKVKVAATQKTAKSAAAVAKAKKQQTKAGVKAATAVKATKKAVVKVAAKKPAAVVKKPIVAKPAIAKVSPKAVNSAKIAQKPEIAKVAVPPHVRPAAVPASQATVAKSVPAAVAKQSAQRISSPPIAPKEPMKGAVPPRPAVAAPTSPVVQAAQAPGAPKKPVSTRHGFKTNEFIVYPAHGVGRIVGIEEQEIAGMALELFVITFEKDKMTLRVPTGKLQSVGMRKLADEAIVKRAMETLKGRARIKRTMWSRRAQEYEAKINSGDLISIAEVVRDLYRSESQPEQSYSERQLYEAALDRMAREIAAVDKLDERGAVQKITEVLAKSAKGRRAAEAEAGDDDESDEEVQAA